MTKNLLIVESPAKAKTIEKFLGKDFKVKSSYGHIRDLAKGKKGIDIENDFNPKYEVSDEKIKVVNEIKKEIKKADQVWLATDEDREGEAISWHICDELNLDTNTTKRIVFREITKPAITSAVNNPRKIDMDLVNAQQARRILDRLVGFELSEILWRKVRGKLSAGRVQSVAVKLIVEKEREITNFEHVQYFKIVANFDIYKSDNSIVNLKAEHKSRFDSESAAYQFLENCKHAEYEIRDIKKKPKIRKPPAPFTTSTLQQEASRKLGFNVNRTMSNAQRLYEQGFITYMRTDSTFLSQQAIGQIKSQIETTYGDQYYKFRVFKSKTSNAQEAHEAIRPTYFDREYVSSDRDQQRLYNLIRKRTLASQMANAEMEVTNVIIGISTLQNEFFIAEGEIMKFDGFLKVYVESKEEDQNSETKGILPPLTVGQILNLNTMTATEKHTRPPARYSEANLIKKLEELGIGRPSTYAPTISKITQPERGYVVKESREGIEKRSILLTLHDNNIEKSTFAEIVGATSNKLYATDLGKVVIDFLSEHFSEIMNYNFTAEVENKLDLIAKGGQDWKKMLKDFYFPFHDDVEDIKENAARASAERILGTHPESGRTVLVRMARFGPVVQIGSPEELNKDEKPVYANLKPTQSLENISFEKALELFKLPKTLGNHKDKEIIIASGRFGAYIKYDELNINIPKSVDPFTIEKERAVELIEEKIKENLPIGTYKGLSITKGKGRFGPYLKYDGYFVNVSKKYDFENLQLEQAFELIEAKLQKEANRYINRWEAENIAVENGRWGPFIRYKKKSIALPKVDNKRMTSEQAKELTLNEVKKIIENELPNAFKKKGK